MQFKIESFLNQNLPAGGTRVDVVFSLSATGRPDAARPGRVIGLLGDRSGSMAGDKMQALKHAMRVAIDAMDDDTEFFVVAFDTAARLAVPLTRADAAGTRAGHAGVQRLEAGGGTSLSSALMAARETFAKRPGAVCQAILLTDGQNGPEDARPLEAGLQACAGLFQVHCRGVGTDWSPPELPASPTGCWARRRWWPRRPPLRTTSGPRWPPPWRWASPTCGCACGCPRTPG